MIEKKDLEELIKILKDLNCYINLIPLNPIKEYDKERPSISNIEKFQQELKKIWYKCYYSKRDG